MTDYVIAIKHHYLDREFITSEHGDTTVYENVDIDRNHHPDEQAFPKPSKATLDANWAAAQTWWNGEQDKLQAERDLHVSDVGAGYVRVMEDLLDLLDAQGIINIVDLPANAQAKHQARKDARNTISS